MTPTEKRYTKVIGKLCWIKTRTWKAGGGYELDYILAMPIALNRGGYRGKGAFQYTVQILGVTEEKAGFWMAADGTTRMGCARFEYKLVDGNCQKPAI